MKNSKPKIYSSNNAEYFEEEGFSKMKSLKPSKSKTKSWPGLTPGLAPVDYESDSDSE